MFYSKEADNLFTVVDIFRNKTMHYWRIT